MHERGRYGGGGKQQKVFDKLKRKICGGDIFLVAANYIATLCVASDASDLQQECIYQCYVRMKRGTSAFLSKRSKIMSTEIMMCMDDKEMWGFPTSA